MSLLLREERKSIVLTNKGEKLFGMLHTPLIESTEPPPLVILFHGFASHKIGTNRSHVRLAQALAEHGIASFRFDFRGCGESEGDLSQLGVEDLFSDALYVTSFFQKEGYRRIGLFGSSFGGSLAILVASQVKEIATLATWAPIASGELWIRDFMARSPGATSFTQYRGATISALFQEQFVKMKAYLALSHLNHIPLLHLQGDKDEVISEAHRVAFEKSRKGALTESRFLLYPDVGHSMGYSACFPEVMKESLAWFEKYL